jgi:hypothetical protein
MFTPPVMTTQASDRARTIVGWGAVLLSAFLGCFWALWGAIENFHEGWYFESTVSNVGLMLAQYLSPAILFVGLGLLSQRLPRVGGALHALVAVGVVAYIRTPAATTWVAVPFAIMSVAYWLGRIPRGRVPVLLVAVLPVMVGLAAGVGPAVRVARRVDDGRRDARLIAGDGVTLLWAPEGPGWPTSGAPWSAAVRQCAGLSEDGRTETAASAAVSPWRMPTVDEVVRSMVHHGQNAGGAWDAPAARATYRDPPDKETPLWNPHSQIIYWWTATELDSARALSITYDGTVRPRPKRVGYGYLGFRCVR